MSQSDGTTGTDAANPHAPLPTQHSVTTDATQANAAEPPAVPSVSAVSGQIPTTVATLDTTHYAIGAMGTHGMQNDPTAVVADPSTWTTSQTLPPVDIITTDTTNATAHSNVLLTAETVTPSPNNESDDKAVASSAPASPASADVHVPETSVMPFVTSSVDGTLGGPTNATTTPALVPPAVHPTAPGEPTMAAASTPPDDATMSAGMHSRPVTTSQREGSAETAPRVNQNPAVDVETEAAIARDGTSATPTTAASVEAHDVPPATDSTQLSMGQADPPTPLPVAEPSAPDMAHRGVDGTDKAAKHVVNDGDSGTETVREAGAATDGISSAPTQDDIAPTAESPRVEVNPTQRKNMYLIRASDHAHTILCDTSAHCARLLGVDRAHVAQAANKPIIIYGWFCQHASVFHSEEGQAILNSDTASVWEPSKRKPGAPPYPPRDWIQELPPEDVEFGRQRNVIRNSGGPLHIPSKFAKRSSSSKSSTREGGHSNAKRSKKQRTGGMFDDAMEGDDASGGGGGKRRSQMSHSDGVRDSLPQPAFKRPRISNKQLAMEVQRIRQSLDIPSAIPTRSSSPLAGFSRAQLSEGLELGLFTPVQAAAAAQLIHSDEGSAKGGEAVAKRDPYFELSHEDRALLVEAGMRQVEAIGRDHDGGTPHDHGGAGTTSSSNTEDGPDGSGTTSTRDDREDREDDASEYTPPPETAVDVNAANERDVHGRTLLHRAAAEDGDVTTPMIDVLDRGSNVLALDCDGWTPLHYAGDASVALQLVAAGASPSYAGVIDGKTPLELAAEYQHRATLAVLLLAGGNAGKVDL
eukprot:m.189957 g.189957  ORF g.189957 m.189957 type:complete len:810 (-) comp17906_c0_seq1:299-2728(-)